MIEYNLTHTYRSAFLFVRTSTDGGDHGWSDIPTFRQNSPTGILDHFISTLVCDPQVSIYRAAVTLSSGGTELGAEIISNQPPFGNIPSAFPNLTFPLFFRGAIDTAVADDHTGQRIADVAEIAFLGDRMPPPALNPDPQIEAGPSDLAAINKNMNTYAQSAAKAYLSGDVSTDLHGELQEPPYSTLTRNATFQVEKIGLITSIPFFVYLSIIVGVLEICLLVLLFMVEPRELLLFNLETLKSMFKGLSVKLDQRVFPSELTSVV
jgi:hypothetical protein